MPAADLNLKRDAKDEILERLLVPAELTVKEALKKLDDGAQKILFIIRDGNKLCGTVSDGDVRRWILKGGDLSARIEHFYNRVPKKIEVGYDAAAAKDMMLKEKIEAIPVVDNKGEIVKVLFWSDLFSGQAGPEHKRISVPVVIMAGGKGSRLDPFTRILPKPLIPIGEKPVVEIIMDRFAEFGCSDFYLTVNYKAKMIQSYFENADCPHKIKLISEPSPRGTAGSLREAADVISASTFFATNCDILLKADYFDILDFHKRNKAVVTIVSSMQHFSVPYGVLKTKNGGLLDRIDEKPEFNFLVNTGMYVVEREVAKQIPENVPCDFPELLTKLTQEGSRVCVYPVSQQTWLDVGQWREYHEALKKLES